MYVYPYHRENGLVILIEAVLNVYPYHRENGLLILLDALSKAIKCHKLTTSYLTRVLHREKRGRRLSPFCPDPGGQDR
jgi:hypothetical protein